MNDWKVSLPQFEGPLDLLLHLVRVNEVEITNLPIVAIAERRKQLAEDPTRIDRVLDDGAAKARESAGATLALVRDAMGLGR